MNGIGSSTMGLCRGHSDTSVVSFMIKGKNDGMHSDDVAKPRDCMSCTHTNIPGVDMMTA